MLDVIYDRINFIDKKYQSTMEIRLRAIDELLNLLEEKNRCCLKLVKEIGLFDTIWNLKIDLKTKRNGLNTFAVYVKDVSLFSSQIDKMLKHADKDSFTFNVENICTFEITNKSIFMLPNQFYRDNFFNFIKENKIKVSLSKLDEDFDTFILKEKKAASDMGCDMEMFSKFQKLQEEQLIEIKNTYEALINEN